MTMNTRNYLSNKKGINTILAALLMVVIVVVAAVMVYAWSTGLLGTLLVNPNNNKEGPLTLDTTASYPGNYNVTLYIRNSGTLGVTMTSFYVTDSNNDIWQDVNWANGPSITPNTVLALTISIPTTTAGTACLTSTGGANSQTACSYVAGSGAGFGNAASGQSSFGSGAYTVKVITGRNNPFSFSITK